MNRETEVQAMQIIEQEAQAWVVRLASGQATSQDAQAFKRWCARSAGHASAFVQARAVWKDMRTAAQRLPQNVPAVTPPRRSFLQGWWSPTSAPQSSRKPVPVMSGRRAFVGGAVAASVAYLAWRPPLDLWPSAAELAADFSADYRTATGEQRQIVLADGTQLQMNTQTRINLRSAAPGSEALELLAGEAEIRTGGKGAGAVSVRAAGGEISGAGSFNIRHTDQDVCVSCLRGQVAVERGSRRVTLQAGEQLTYGPQGLGNRQPVDAGTVSGWRQGMLVFRQVPLVQVVAEVNRYRPGKLILNSDALGRNKVQASFALDRLDDVVALIRDVYGARVTRLPGGIVLLGLA